MQEELDSLPETNDPEAQAGNPADGQGVQPATLQDIDPFESKAQGGMVETERDRLIRLVSLLFLHHTSTCQCTTRDSDVFHMYSNALLESLSALRS